MSCELADDSELFIFSDGTKDNSSTAEINAISEVRSILKKEMWCKEVHISESPKNKGLAKSVTEGVSKIIEQYGKAIILEDDIVPSKYFLRFMNECLNFYEDDQRIFSIGGMNYIFPIPEDYKEDVFLAHRANSSGWGTWKDRWMKADFHQKDYSQLLKSKKEIRRFNRGGDDLINILRLQLEGKIDSWAIRWDYCHYINDAYCIHPVKSFARNIGCDGSGVHAGNQSGDLYSGIPYEKSDYKIILRRNLLPDKRIEKNFKEFFDGRTTIFQKTKRKLKSILKKIRLKKSSISLKRIKPYSSVFGLDRGTPVDRVYIEKFLSSHKQDIRGVVLEIAEPTYSKKFGINVSSFEILHFDKTNQNATITGDLSKPEDLPEKFTDCFICTQTLNFIYNIQSAIRGCYRLLKDNGVFLGTVAGISQISRYDMERWGDYWRFTDLSVKKLFGEVFGEDNIQVEIYGNALAATAFIQGLSADEIPNSENLFDTDQDYPVIIGIKAIKRVKE